MRRAGAPDLRGARNGPRQPSPHSASANWLIICSTSSSWSQPSSITASSLYFLPTTACPLLLPESACGSRRGSENLLRIRLIDAVGNDADHHFVRNEVAFSSMMALACDRTSGAGLDGRVQVSSNDNRTIPCSAAMVLVLRALARSRRPEQDQVHQRLVASSFAFSTRPSYWVSQQMALDPRHGIHRHADRTDKACRQRERHREHTRSAARAARTRSTGRWRRPP